jgi:hypothetical protein
MRLKALKTLANRALSNWGFTNVASKKAKSVHAMTSEQASEKKIRGHKNEIDFNERFGNKSWKISYSKPTSDCAVSDKAVLKRLIDDLGVKSGNVSLKSGNTIQIHLGWISELTDRDKWTQCLRKIKLGKKFCTSSDHGLSFEKQQQVLKGYEFWKKYLGKGDILCYRASETTWLFFNMDIVIDFITRRITWRLLKTGRIKGDFGNTQLLTYEYRPEEHKKRFVLGAHGGRKGWEFIETLKEQIPYVEIDR